MPPPHLSKLCVLCCKDPNKYYDAAHGSPFRPNTNQQTAWLTTTHTQSVLITEPAIISTNQQTNKLKKCVGGTSTHNFQFHHTSSGIGVTLDPHTLTDNSNIRHQRPIQVTADVLRKRLKCKLTPVNHACHPVTRAIVISPRNIAWLTSDSDIAPTHRSQCDF